MIRVLHVFYKMGNGGIEHFVMNLYRHINREKIQFDFLTSVNEEGYFDDEIKKLGGKLYHAYPLKKNPIKNYRSIAKIVSENNYQIIHRHTGSAFGYYELRAAKKGGAQNLILHSHSCGAGKKIIHKALKKTIKIPCIKLACSLEAGQFLFGEEAHFTVIKNGIDCEQYRFNETLRRNVRNKLKIENKFVVGHIGRFSDEKNHKKLFNIAKALKLYNSNSILICVGGGSLFEELKSYAVELEIEDDVLFLGNRDDVDVLINSFDVFCFPSKHEGFGITLIEAQANGLKCFTSQDNVPSSTNITGNVVFLPLDKPSDEWAKKIISCNNTRDFTAIEEIKKAGYDLIHTAKEMELFYLDLLS